MILQKGRSASGNQQRLKVIRKQHEPGRFSFELLKLELLELEMLGLQLRESGSRGRVPSEMCCLSSTCRKLPTSISHRSQQMVMQRRCHVDEYPVCARRMCPAILTVVVFASVALSVLPVGYATDHNREHACNMANLRIRIMCGRINVRT